MFTFPPDGVEEVFAAVGESVSLSCGNTSSLGAGGSVKWAVGGRTLTDDHNGLPVDKDPSLVISKVSAQHAGDYQCSESTDQKKVFNKIRLHAFDGECENKA